MAQKEFDLRMEECSRMESEEMAPVLKEMKCLLDEHEQMVLQMLELDKKISILKRRMAELADEKRRIEEKNNRAKKKMICEEMRIKVAEARSRHGLR